MHFLKYQFQLTNLVSRIQNNLDINASNLNEGIYILEIVSDKEVDKVKVVIERNK